MYCSVNSSAICRRGICYTSCCWGFSVELQCNISGFELWRKFPCSVSVSVVQAGSHYSHMTIYHLSVWVSSVGYCSSDCAPHAIALREKACGLHTAKAWPASAYQGWQLIHPLIHPHNYIFFWFSPVSASTVHGAAPLAHPQDLWPYSA